MLFTRLTLNLICLMVVGSAVIPVAQAAPIQPFDAVVQSPAGEEVLVRSGPGVEKHYPTLKLSNGDKVHVLRKDPGGWFMIDPPPGSYSWILARYVQRNGGPQGTVTENGVVVRVGAWNSTQRDVEQIRLNKGDTVEILGEQILDSDKGKDQWLKIKPPRNERRWIKGSYLVELNPDGTPKVLPKGADPRSPGAVDAAAAPSPKAPVVAGPTKPRGAAKSPAIATDLPADGGEAPLYGHPPGRKPETTDPFADLTENSAVAPSLGSQTEEQAIREDLKLLDIELQRILQKPAVEWELGVQREDLESLKQLAGSSPLVTQIDERLKRLEGYERIHEDALVQQQRTRPGRPQGTQILNSQQPTGNLAPQVTQETQRFPPGPIAPNPVAPAPTEGSASLSRSPAGNRFVGAGIVHRLPNPQPGMPAYVIAAPDRRILCYLDPAPGINLQQYVGQSMGLMGQRGYDPRLRADRMRVESLTPVRLAR